MSEMRDLPGASGAAPAAVTTAPAPTLGDDAMPPLFHDADKRAIRAQKFFFGWLEWELILLGLGVLVGALSGITRSIGPVSLVIPPFTVGGFHITTLTAFEIARGWAVGPRAGDAPDPGHHTARAALV